MSIQAYVSELQNLNIELKRLKQTSSELRKKIKIVENNIMEYLQEKQQPGVKYHDTAIIIENKSKRTSKPKKDKEEDALRILEQYGIKDSKNLLEQILEAGKGEEVEINKLKIKKIKKNNK
jgi:hypothetical protein